MTHCHRFQARLSFLYASFARHRPVRPADQIIFLSAFNRRLTDLLCPASKPRKSVDTHHSAPLSAEP